MTGWIAVQRELLINHHLENSPLQIRTDSVVGSQEAVRVGFYTAGVHNAGGVHLHFTSPPQYFLSWCSTSRTNFPTTLPTETDKIWTLTLTRTSSTVRLIITSNNKEILNVVLTSTTCTDSHWSTIWSRDVETIYFPSGDTASDYFRPGKFN